MAPKKPGSARPKSGDTSERKAKSPKKKTVKKKVKKAGAEAGAPEANAEEEEVLEVCEEGEEEEDAAPEATEAAGTDDDTTTATADASAAPAPSENLVSAANLLKETAASALLALLPKLKETERAARAARGALPRPLSLPTLESLEGQVCDLLGSLEPATISETAPTIASLLDAGSADFFGGERGDVGMRVHSAARGALARIDSGQAAGSGTSTEKGVAAEVTSISKTVSALTKAGYLASCILLWVPARDGDAGELSRLLDLVPWTVDEPGRDGQGYTSALQVACAAGHEACVQLLLDAGAIFRDHDWHPSANRPYVCTSMLSGAGYTSPPEGQAAGSAPRSRAPRETYVKIIDMLLAEATFCDGQMDRDTLTATRQTMLASEPAAEPADTAVQAAAAQPADAAAETAAVAPPPEPAPPPGSEEVAEEIG